MKPAIGCIYNTIGHLWQQKKQAIVLVCSLDSINLLDKRSPLRHQFFRSFTEFLTNQPKHPTLTYTGFTPDSSEGAQKAYDAAAEALYQKESQVVNTGLITATSLKNTTSGTTNYIIVFDGIYAQGGSDTWQAEVVKVKYDPYTVKSLLPINALGTTTTTVTTTTAASPLPSPTPAAAVPKPAAPVVTTVTNTVVVAPIVAAGANAPTPTPTPVAKAAVPSPSPVVVPVAKAPAPSSGALQRGAGVALAFAAVALMA